MVFNNRHGNVVKALFGGEKKKRSEETMALPAILLVILAILIGKKDFHCEVFFVFNISNN